MKKSIFNSFLLCLLLQLGLWPALHAQERTKEKDVKPQKRIEKHEDVDIDIDETDSWDSDSGKKKCCTMRRIHIPAMSIPEFDIDVPEVPVPEFHMPDIEIPPIELPDMTMLAPHMRFYYDQNDSDQGKYEQKKTASASYTLDKGTQIQVSNRFGNVQVQTWDKNEVSFEVQINVHAGSEAKAKELLDKISIEFKQDKQKNMVSALTQFGNDHVNVTGALDFKVNYKINLPKDASFSLSNSFGDVTMPDYAGKLNLDINYGKLTAGALSNADNNVKVSFGGADIKSYDQGKLTARYSDVSIGQAGDITLSDDFSKVSIQSAKNITLNSRYGDMKLGTIGSVNGSSQFSQMKVDELQQLLDMSVNYCPSFKVARVNKGFDRINLTGAYSTYSLYFDDDAGFNFDVSLQSGDLDVLKGLVRYDVNRTESSSSAYKGSFGNAGKANVNVNARYSKVRFATAP